MNLGFPHWKTIISRPAFRLAWAVLALCLVAIVIVIICLPIIPMLITIAILLSICALAFTSIYAAAQNDWMNTLGRHELKSIISAIEDAMILYDENFSIIFFNPAAEKLFKLGANVAMGHVLTPRDVENMEWRTLAQVIFPSLAPQVVSVSPEGQYPTIAEISFGDPELELRVTTAPIIDENGKTLAFMKLINNLTPQISALRTKEDFIAVASHQLRGPVTDINWALQALASATDLGDESKGIVQNAAAASQGLLHRIEDFLDLSRLDGGKLLYDFKEMDVIDFLQSVLGEVMPAARTAGIKLYFDRPPVQLPPVMIDAKRLSMVMVNIIENAIRYNIENGEVIVKAEAEPERPFIEITVRDTGIGMPADAIPKLFTKFFRAENAIKSQTEGSGIGLYIARGIVRAHGGEIWAESELGRGTTVHFTIPTDPNLVPKNAATTTGF